MIWRSSMEQLFITNLSIKKVRHLKDIFIPLSEEKIKHLILTGKNGSGKTSVVEALAKYINNIFTDQYFEERATWLKNAERNRNIAVQNGKEEAEILKLENKVYKSEEDLKESRNGLDIQFNHKRSSVIDLSKKYHYIFAYYKADRIFQAEQPKHVEKVQLKDYYGLQEFPRNEFVKYLLDLIMTVSLAIIFKSVE